MPLAEALTRGRGDYVTINGENRHVVGYMKDFLFAPEQKGTPLGVLSGGERGRLMLARALASPANLLVLDEPTNDLDLETLDLLQEMLTDFPGTVILVSHDRDFLDRVCTSVLVSEGAGRWIEYAGGYSDMVMQRGAGVSARTVEKPKAESAAAPRRAPRSRRTSSAGSCPSRTSTISTPCPPGWRRCSATSPSCRRSSPIPASMPATAPPSTRRAPP